MYFSTKKNQIRICPNRLFKLFRIYTPVAYTRFHLSQIACSSLRLPHEMFYCSLWKRYMLTLTHLIYWFYCTCWTLQGLFRRRKKITACQNLCHVLWFMWCDWNDLWNLSNAFEDLHFFLLILAITSILYRKAEWNYQLYVCVLKIKI